MRKEEFIKIVKTSKNKSDICRAMNMPTNGYYMKKVDKMFEEFSLQELKTELKLKSLKRPGKYNTIEKKCPVCGTVFTTKKNHKREKVTCSHSCSNTYFRSNVNNPNWKESSYRSTCFHYHDKKCVICGEDKIVEVHHFDENNKNNSPENLIPLCPTHHQYWHSSFKEDVYDVVVKYRDSFILKK